MDNTLTWIVVVGVAVLIVLIAETLLDEVMSERGYPVDDFEQQADLISVDHPDLVENYRIAHTQRGRIDEGSQDTEASRGAVLRYRPLFDEFLAPDSNRAA